VSLERAVLASALWLSRGGALFAESVDCVCESPDQPAPIYARGSTATVLGKVVAVEPDADDPCRKGTGITKLQVSKAWQGKALEQVVVHTGCVVPGPCLDVCDEFGVVFRNSPTENVYISALDDDCVGAKRPTRPGCSAEGRSACW
jgi:hypothetical protein